VAPTKVDRSCIVEAGVGTEAAQAEAAVIAVQALEAQPVVRTPAENLYDRIENLVLKEELAGKVTGMLLEVIGANLPTGETIEGEIWSILSAEAKLEAKVYEVSHTFCVRTPKHSGHHLHCLSPRSP
jgi:hypothetical protein